MEKTFSFKKFLSGKKQFLEFACGNKPFLAPNDINIMLRAATALQKFNPEWLPSLDKDFSSLFSGVNLVNKESLKIKVLEQFTDKQEVISDYNELIDRIDLLSRSLFFKIISVLPRLQLKYSDQH